MYKYAVRTEEYSASSAVQTKGLNLVETKIKCNSDAAVRSRRRTAMLLSRVLFSGSE